MTLSHLQGHSYCKPFKCDLTRAMLLGKICVLRPVEKSRAQIPYRQNLCPSTVVVRVHGGALAEEYAVSSTTLVVSSQI